MAISRIKLTRVPNKGGVLIKCTVSSGTNFFYNNINCRLNILIDGSWSIGELESKIWRMGRSHWTILVAK